MKLSFRFDPTLASEATRRHRRRSLVLASVGLAVLPLAWHGVSCGHDFDFHLQSWMEAERTWKQGLLYPHWAGSANFGAGEPRFVFYPPLSWALGGLLGAVLPWPWVPLVFTVIALLAMASTFFLMARQWISEDNAALAACLYVLSPYVMFVVYERAAYGELLAAVWLPPLVLYALRVKPALPQMALMVAALWLTNAPAAVMSCYGVGLLVLWTAIAERRWILMARALGATALGLGMAGLYLVPAVWEQRWVEIARVLAPGMRVEDSFLFGHTGEVFHDQVLHTASWIAVVLLAAVVLAAFLSQRIFRPQAPQRPALRKALLFLAAVILCLLLPFSAGVWRHAPELRFLQFPWRWLLVLSLVAALLAGMSPRYGAGTRRTISLRALAILLLACVMAGISGSYYLQPCDEEDNVRAQLATFADDGFAGTDEYTAAPADNGDIQQDLPEVRMVRQADGDEADSSVAENPEWNGGKRVDLQPSQIQIKTWETEHRTVIVDTLSPGFALIRLMDYPAWDVRVNRKRVKARPKRDDGLMAIPVAAGRSVIEIRYGTTVDMWLGRAISVAAAFLFLSLRAAGLWRRQRVS